MLLKSYPDKKDVLTRRNEQVVNNANLKKSRNNLIKNIIIALVIIVVSFFIPNIFFRILCILISFYPLFVAFYAFRYVLLSTKTDLYTKIYDDRIVHIQYGVFMRNKYEYTVFYDKIDSFRQDLLGNLIFELKDTEIIVKKINCKKEENIINSKKSVTLFFVDSEPKYDIMRLLDRRLKKHS